MKWLVAHYKISTWPLALGYWALECILLQSRVRVIPDSVKQDYEQRDFDVFGVKVLLNFTSFFSCTRRDLSMLQLSEVTIRLCVKLIALPAPRYIQWL